MKGWSHLHDGNLYNSYSHNLHRLLSLAKFTALELEHNLQHLENTVFSIVLNNVHQLPGHRVSLPTAMHTQRSGTEELPAW